jgi:hypothetical protein
MRHPSAYYLLLLYVTVVCRPLIPLLHDWYEHSFNEVEHLATVHHQNGMNHVNYEIGKMEKEDNNPSNNPSKAKTWDETTVHFPAENNFGFKKIVAACTLIYFDQQHILPVVFTAIQLPPPKL